MSVSNIFFAFVALVAVTCFAVLIGLQVSEDKYYKDPMAPGGNVWPTPVLQPVAK